MTEERTDAMNAPTPPLRTAVVAAAAALALLWAPLPATGPALSAQAGSAAADSPDERIPPRPIDPPVPFHRAVDAGTRTAEGRPGATYWQQEADYRIDAELDPATGRVDARETIVYHNRSPDTLDSILLHLDQNVFAEGARRNRRAPITGGTTVRNVRVDGRAATTRHPGSSYYQALTLLEVRLPRSLPPGDSVEIALGFGFTVPPAPTFRNGNVDGELFGVAQWYPRVAVYDDVYGWNHEPYQGDGEFYMEYGDFDVRITVPAGWVVGATGTLRNPEEVLRPESLRRLRRARASDEVVRIITSEEAEDGRTTRGDEGDRLTWRFTASRVRDFAFATSADYAWDAVGVEVAGRSERVLAHAFYRPRLTTWRDHGAEFVAHSLRTLSDWLGSYPYPQLSIAEGPTGGMEYPMFIFNPSTNSERGLAGVTIHEAAHQWYPMAVGTMESKHAWMDEGIVSYWDEMSLAVLYDEEPPRWGETRSYLRVAGDEWEVPLMRHTDLVSPYGYRGVAAYTKPAVVLGALREVVGDETFLAAFRDFYRSWEFKHPQPWDFFNTVERHHGEDLDWFWRPLFFETDVLDHAVAAVEAGAEETRIRIEDRGWAVLPTPVRVVLEDGSERELRISAGQWLRGGRSYETTIPGRAVEVQLDPEGLFPDVDRSNNDWTADGG